jgi:uncharacterized protein YndB with AHSA1/START domain
MSNDLKVEISQVFDAPVEKIFRAWVDPEQMKQWYSPEGMSTSEAVSEMKKEGHYSVTMEMANNQQFKVSGQYLEYVEPEKLVFSWDGASVEGKLSQVTVLFKSLGENKTEVTLIHTGFASEESKARHQDGWVGTFSMLSKYLKGNK